jgi:hypothetical protein
MTAIEDPRTVRDMGNRLGNQLTRGAMGNAEVIAAADMLDRYADLIEALTAPPTEDERDALAEIAREAWAHYQVIHDDPEFGGDFEDVLAYRLGLASFRRQGPITDAMVLAGAKEIDPDAFEVPLRGYGEGAAAQAREHALEASRDVLEAAERARC